MFKVKAFLKTSIAQELLKKSKPELFCSGYHEINYNRNSDLFYSFSKHDQHLVSQINSAYKMFCYTLNEKNN